jgi:3-phosphoshikimate 1-carboxyvinyltransferase
MSSTFAVTVQPAARMCGRVRPPGDKSISHRYAMLASIADGPSVIYGYSTGGDCASTLLCLRALGVPGRANQPRSPGRYPSGNPGPSGRRPASARPPPWTPGNSGSTIRMLSGILAAHPFRATMTGDGSLRRRPMRRIIVPLERMGARFISEDGRPPLTVMGRRSPTGNRLPARRRQRAGQERRALRGTSRRRDDACRRTDVHARPH